MKPKRLVNAEKAVIETAKYFSFFGKQKLTQRQVNELSRKVVIYQLESNEGKKAKLLEEVERLCIKVGIQFNDVLDELKG